MKGRGDLGAAECAGDDLVWERSGLGEECDESRSLDRRDLVLDRASCLCVSVRLSAWLSEGFAWDVGVCVDFADDEPDGWVERGSVAFAERVSFGFAGGISVWFAEESVAQEARDEEAPDDELDDVDDDALGVELAQNGRRLNVPSSSLRVFLRLLRFLHSSTRAL